MIGRTITRLSIAVVIAEDGQQAADKALAESFDLILMEGDGTAGTDVRRSE